MVYDVFLSYRRSDGLKIAEMLYRFLTGKGLRVFFDKEEMDTGYFDEQIHGQVIGAPNYIFLGTPDAFRFREGVFDYVREEIRLALREYDRDPENRVVLPILPIGVDFPRREELPAGCEGIARHDAVILKGDLPDNKELDKVLRRVTKVSRRNLWQAGHRWLSNKRLPGGRFQLLNIDENIFSQVQRIGGGSKIFGRNKWGEDREEERNTLTEVLADTKQHLYLSGEGGIGKTTMLIHIMEQVYGAGAYDQCSQVPLFVELSRAPDLFGRLYEGGVCTFIRRAIYQQLRDDRSVRQVSSQEIGGLEEAFMVDPQMAVVPINDLFAREAPAPEYLILLDGLNEVSRVEIPETGKTVVQMVLGEIEWLMTECPNVRVILTGRSADVGFAADNLLKVACCGLRDEDILRYLQVKVDPAMMNILRVPLFLTMYAAVGPSVPLKTRGEILHAFFHHGREELPVYSARTRIGQIDRDVSSASRVRQERRITSQMQYFLLDFLLPEIGWEMEAHQQYYLRLNGKSGIRAVMERVLTGTEDTDFCGEYGCEIFTLRSEGGRKQNIRRIARDIMECLGEDRMEIAETLVDCAVMSLGVLREAGNGSYEFAHEHFRDYFAAVREIHSLMLARRLYEEEEQELAEARLASWRRTPLGRQMRRFIGEILGEPGALLRSSLDLFRGRFDGSIGYAVFNILAIMKETRGNLSGENFSHLDLTGCELNGAVLGEKGCHANFEGAKVLDSLFLPGGHVGYILSAGYTPDSTRILTAARDGAVRIWDAATFTEVRVLHQGEKMVLAAICSPDGTRIAVMQKRCVDIYYTESGERIAEATFSDEPLLSCVWHPDGRQIALGDASGKILICDAESLAVAREFQSHGETVNAMDFYPDGRLITSDEGGWIRVYDIDAGEIQWERTLEGPLPDMKVLIKYVEVSPDGRRLLIISEFGRIQLWDSGMTEMQHELGDLFKSGFRTAHFRGDGKQVIAEDHGKVCLWDAETGEPLRAGISSDHFISRVFFSPNGKQILALMGDNYVTVYDAVTRELTGVLGSPVGRRVESAVFCDDDRHIITAAADGTIRTWDAASGKLFARWPEACSEYRAACISPDGKRYCAADRDGSLYIYDQKTGSAMAKSAPDDSYVIKIYWSPDGTEVASVSIGGLFRIFDAEDLSLRDAWMEDLRDVDRDGNYYGTEVTCAAYSPDGTLLLTGTGAGEVWIRNARTREVLKKIVRVSRGYKDLAGPYVNQIAFHPEGEVFLTEGNNSAVRLWNVRTGEKIGSLQGSSDVIRAYYAPEGRTIAGFMGEGEIGIWDSRTLRMIRRGRIPGGSIFSMQYSSDGKTLLVVSNDNCIRLLDAQTLACLQTIRYIPGLDVMGCDFRKIHPESSLSAGIKKILQAYGGSVGTFGCDPLQC